MYISETNLFWFVHRLEMLCTKNYKDQQSALMTSTPLRTIFFWKMVILKKFLHRSLSIKSAMHGPEKCFTYLKLSWTTRPPPIKRSQPDYFLQVIVAGLLKCGLFFYLFSIIRVSFSKETGSPILCIIWNQACSSLYKTGRVA